MEFDPAVVSVMQRADVGAFDAYNANTESSRESSTDDKQKHPLEFEVLRFVNEAMFSPWL
jgi:hypothetical protein